jgi:hypothetical protein
VRGSAVLTKLKWEHFTIRLLFRVFGGAASARRVVVWLVGLGGDTAPT